jgi:predicted HD phosphohydrolase
MKNIFLIAAFFIQSFYPAQEIIQFKGEKSCSYYGEKIPDTVAVSVPPTDAEKIISEIISVIGLRPRFETRAADIPNAAAVIYNNKRYVLYNPSFVNSLNKAAGSKWASVSILAHEIGHHLNGHTLEETGSRPDIELEADEFSGFILRKLGATLMEAQVAMKIAADVKASHTHPAQADRLSAIERGWNTAESQITGKKIVNDASLKKPEVTETTKVETAILDEKYIALDVTFNADPEGKYHVTVRNNLVLIKDNQLYVIGRLGESNLKPYPLMFYDQYYNYMYITSKGKILNGNGKKVGRIMTHKSKTSKW